MRRVMVLLAAVAAFSGLAGASEATPRDEVRAYFFGNSLVHHLTDEGRTNVPYWMNQLARADGRQFAVNGQWGFMRDFAANPPTENWSFRGVPRAWNPDRGGFFIGRFDSIIVNPANFIQYQPADRPYDGDNPTGESPLGATVKVFERAISDAPGARFFIYEGWADMAGVTGGGFPPSDRGLRRYHRFNTGDYHDWFKDYSEQVNAAMGDRAVVLIPVASILSELLTSDPLDNLEATVFYLDDAPHGTETLYFLAAMITYSVLYNAPPPADFVPPETLDASVAAVYPELAGRIWEMTLEARAAVPQADLPTQPEQTPETSLAPAPQAPEQQPSQPSPETTEVEEPEVQPAAEQIATPIQPIPQLDGLPALGMGLNGINDWSTQHPFLDIMKTSRPWLGHTAEGWGAFSNEQLRAEGYLDENGWPIRIPDGVNALESFVLTDQPVEAEHLRGWYVLRFDGQGDLKLSGRAKRVSYDPGQARFFYEPGDGPVGIRIERTDPADPIRNITVVSEKFVDLHAAGALFNPEWVPLVADMRSLRFMDWMRTNGSPITSWDDRPRVSDATYATWGVPLEVMLPLANHTGTDPWFTIPHMADDAYVRAFAEQVRDGLDPRLKAYVEYSNEVWNFAFPQAGWARDQSIELWGDSETGWMQFYGKRAAEVADIFTEVFADEADARLVRVVTAHTGWPGLEESILQAPLVLMSKGRAPAASFDAYAVTGYFGLEMGQGDVAGEVRDLIARSTVRAEESGTEQGLRRVALREYVKENRFVAAFDPMADAVRAGTFGELINDTWPYHARAARAAGLDLIMYEGGTHIVGHEENANDESLSAFFNAFNYSPQMTALYAELLQGWSDAGGVLFNAFVDIAPPSQWGSWGHLRHIGDETGRWDIIKAFNASAPNGWEDRASDAFDGGQLVVGGDGSEAWSGSLGDDVFAGRGGDDTFTLRGGYDVVHGGEGTDLAVLPLPQSEYAVRREGDVTLIEADGHSVRLVSVEAVQFGGNANAEPIAVGSL